MMNRDNADFLTVRKRLKRPLAYLVPLVIATASHAAEQLVVVQLSSDIPSVGEVVQATVTYDTANPQDPTLTGIGIRLPWNSSLLNYQQLTNVLSDKLSARGEPEADVANYDGDVDTDKYVHLAWADITNSWPNQGASPTLLFTAEFIVPTAVVGTSLINLSASSTAAGYTFAGTPASIAVDCSGSDIAIQSRTFQTGENVSCTASGTLSLGPHVEQQVGSTLHVTANAGISINGPLNVKTGAIFTATQGGL